MMKHKKYLIFLMFLLCAFIAQDLLAQGISKEMNTGYVRWKIVDSGDEGEGSWGWGGHQTYHDGYQAGLYSSKAGFLGCKDWNGQGLKVSGFGQWQVDDAHVTMPIVDEEGWTIKRQYRNLPPAIVVDGLPLQDPFPFNTSDLLGDAGMPGTVDGKIWSTVNTDMGVTYKLKSHAYSQSNHWQYIIKEYTFINTGNTNNDPEIEEPNNTIKDFYFLKQLRTKENPQKPMMGAYGLRANEDVVVLYGYPSRGQGSDFDNFGGANPNKGGYTDFTYFTAEALLFASKSVAEFNTNAVRVTQPHATMYCDVDFASFTFHTWNMTDFQQTQLVQVMEEGLINVAGINWPEWSEAQWGRQGIPLDRRGFAYAQEMEGYGYSASVAYSFGPYDLNFGDSIKIVVADVMGSLSPEMARDVGAAWLAGTPDSDIGDPKNFRLPPHYADHPELLSGHPNGTDGVAVNTWKDQWIYSGVDSLINNARAAQFAYNNNFNVPQAPPAPSIDVQSKAEGVQITWSYPPEIVVPGDLAGFNVYRAVGQWYAGIEPGYYGTQFLGGWEKIHTAGAGDNTYTDASSIRGVGYFYCVGAFDTGSDNGADMFQGKPITGQVLESNFIQNVTISPASKLTPGADNLDGVVIVPNPFNAAASELQYPGEPNKILFLNVPSVCTIRIFTESGDLVKVIDHVGSGDASWGVLAEEHQATDSQQIVVSGLYIAQIEDQSGNSAIRKFVIVR